ncbi:hypothetical protein [Hymenobacter sp. DG25A]|uniref:hypothetical protein n=1 Tax=Hymenobacter sp. DG25A TaxID=1385663 RepID=UPI0006BC9C4E|nr:hypothetical protein [Hymenobacter sp. DG25A]ALD22204.1 hypothetical protein AM218_14510 [Hymenobacter sp. DG25A]
MKRHFAARRDDDALDRVILTAKLHPLMSNAKWVKLITTLVTNWHLVQACQVKLIWEDIDVERWLLIDEDKSYLFDYYPSAMEAMITGTPRLGWAAYKEIEWLDFPRFPSNKAVTQDLHTIQQKIEEVGHFQMDTSPDNLRLYAYQRP